MYAKKGVPLQTQTETTEKLKGSGASAGGAAGTGSNIPSYAAARLGGGNSNYNSTRPQTRPSASSKKVSHTKVAPGAVNKLGVAVLVDKTVPPADGGRAPVRRRRRGGHRHPSAATRSRSARSPSPSRPPPKTPSRRSTRSATPSTSLLGIALLAFLFFMTRHLRRREDETLMREPMWLREIEAPTLARRARGWHRGADRRCRSRVVRSNDAAAARSSPTLARARGPAGPRLDERGVAR